MRCKNCGSENDDNRYICENCGSPLYDEQDFNNNQGHNQNTQTFNTVGFDESLDLGYTPEPSKSSQNNTAKAAEKKSVIVIAILAVVLIAIIASVIVVAQTRARNEESTTKNTTISTTASTTKHTASTKPTTTERTTESTTESTTKTEEWSIKLVSKGGGTVEGGGTYKDGDNVTIYATPDIDYEFDGWYSNGVKLSSSQQYSFTAVENTSISAVFYPIETQPSTTEEAESLDGGME